jgi:hypothetical protein
MATDSYPCDDCKQDHHIYRRTRGSQIASDCADCGDIVYEGNEYAHCCNAEHWRQIRDLERLRDKKEARTIKEKHFIYKNGKIYYWKMKIDKC